MDETGLNRFSIYGEFNGKKGLFLKACRAYSEMARKQLLTPLRKSKNAETGLRRLFSDVVTRLLDKSTPAGCLMMNTLAEDIARDAGVRRLLNQHFGAFESTFKEALRRASGKSAHPESIGRGADILVNTLLGLGYQVRLYPERERLESITDSAITTALVVARKR
ncbi:MAG: hypothetical protein LV480_14920 [Methylacidiphilales bacterium]|nr:hypothetical protein [Candidatus Methylacidiphilales bacterium]